MTDAARTDECIQLLLTLAGELMEDAAPKAVRPGARDHAALARELRVVAEEVMSLAAAVEVLTRTAR